MASEDEHAVLLGGKQGDVLCSCKGLAVTDGLFLVPLAIGYKLG